jgi:hypothetical protein
MNGAAQTAIPVQKRLENPVFVLEATGLEANPATGFADGIGSAARIIVDSAFSSLLTGGTETLEIRKGKIVVKTSGALSETVDNVDALVMITGKKSVTAKGAMDIRGQRLEFDASSGLPIDRSHPTKSALPVKLSIKGATVQAGFEGRVTSLLPLAMTGQVDATVPQFWRLIDWLGVPSAENGILKNIGVKSQLTWSHGAMAFDKAAVTLDGQQATGAFSISYKTGRPSFEGTIAFPSFDLQPYVRSLVPERIPDDRVSREWTAAQTRLGLVLHTDADLRLSTPKLHYAGAPLGHGAASISIRSGKMHADVAELEINGHKASLQVRGDMNGAFPNYSVRGRLDLANAGPLLTSIFEKSLIEGPGTAHIDLTGSGDSIAQVLRSAAGKAGLVTTAGPKLQGDLQSLKATAVAHEKSREKSDATAIGWGAIANGLTPVDGLEIRADVANGSAIIRKGVVQTFNQKFDLTGRVDFVARQLDIAVRSAPVKSAEGKSVKTSQSAGVPTVLLRGPWERPVVRTDDGKAGKN